tara:strand:+ start:1195 stop:1515 length:321 start_codon:yes stop_codon:yes gene_type:complete
MSNHVTHIKTEDGNLYANTIFYDDAANEKTKRLRESELLSRAKLSVHEDEDIRFSFSIPSVFQYNLFTRDNPETFKLMQSKVEHERMRGAKQFQLLHPEWCISARV